MAAENITKNYTEYFGIEAVEDYLEWFKDPKAQSTTLQKFHKFWKQFSSRDNLKLLEYGGGPIISGLISACPHLEHVVFAEYLECNRKAVENWVKQTPDAFDWKTTFDFIVQELEGGDENEANERQAELRQKIQAFVPCDVKGINLLELPATLSTKYHPPYDVVSTSLCLEAVVESDNEYKEAVAKLAELVKPGGYLVMHGTLQESFYTVGKQKYYVYRLRKEIIVESLENAGIKDIEFNSFSSGLSHHLTDMESKFFVYGKRE